MYLCLCTGSLVRPKVPRSASVGALSSAVPAFLRGACISERAVRRVRDRERPASKAALACKRAPAYRGASNLNARSAGLAAGLTRISRSLAPTPAPVPPPRSRRAAACRPQSWSSSQLRACRCIFVCASPDSRIFRARCVGFPLRSSVRECLIGSSLASFSVLCRFTPPMCVRAIRARLRAASTGGAPGATPRRRAATTISVWEGC